MVSKHLRHLLTVQLAPLDCIAWVVRPPPIRIFLVPGVLCQNYAVLNPRVSVVEIMIKKKYGAVLILFMGIIGLLMYHPARRWTTYTEASPEDATAGKGPWDATVGKGPEQKGPEHTTVEKGPEHTTVEKGPEHTTVEKGPGNATVEKGPESATVEKGPGYATVGKGPRNSTLGFQKIFVLNLPQ